MIYLTFNDPPSGIYFSQVTDVCTHLNEKENAGIRLLAFISIRGFFSNKNRILQELPHAIVLPLFPKLRNWRINAITLWVVSFFIPSKKIIARGPLAANLALFVKKWGRAHKVCLDARGAFAEEVKEYRTIEDESLRADIANIEKNAVLKSDFRIAVTQRLVSYWREAYHYDKEQQVVIPCTVHSEYFKNRLNEEQIKNRRQELGYSEKDMVLVYSGSNAQWQSFDLLNDFLLKHLMKIPALKILFLAKQIPSRLQSVQMHSNRIACKWVEEKEVMNYLSACDYGLLLREETLTNRVASPVKVAEYLAAGLKVITSPQVGDYSDFVITHHCGYLFREEELKLQPIPFFEKKRISAVAYRFLTKPSFESSYKRLLLEMNT
jgi:glycosyltransferase involved in cell wall biosynthesis